MSVCTIINSGQIIVSIYLFVHIFELCMKCIQFIAILVRIFCPFAYLYISLCIEVILSLFMILCFSCILSWITCIEFVMSLNIHQVFGVSLEQ